MKTYETDVCVIAGGPAGLAAAISAAERGMNVILLEKAQTTGGAANMGMGPLGIGTRLAKENMVDLDVEKAFNIFMNYTHWRVDAKLVKAYLEKSGSTIAWLEDMGVVFASLAKYFPSSQATWHMVKPASGRPGPRSASVMCKAMTERAVELGVNILYETPACHLERGKEGYITAVLAKHGDEDVRVECLAAVLATGGFGDNPEMIHERMGYDWGKDLFSFRIPGVTGDGVRMAAEVGAQSTDVNMELVLVTPKLADHGLPMQVWKQPKALVLNDRCERIMNEELMENSTFSGNAVAIQHGRMAWSILDSSIVDHYRKNGLDIISNVHFDQDLSHFDEDLTTAIQNGLDTVCAADSLDELAAQMGVDPDKLSQAVEEYNHGCQEKDDYFYKKKANLVPLNGPRYYAVKLFPGGYGTLGGIKINYKTEVLDQDNQVIEGLYAAGTDACSIFGDSYVFVLPGNTMGFALNSGRMAGENAADYVLSVSS